MQKVGRGLMGLTVILLAATCFADTHWKVQGITPDGDGNHPDLLTMNKVTVEGVILNDPLYIVDGTPDEYAPEGPGGMWEIYIQGGPGDHAGTAIWMGQCYDNVWGNGTYTDAEWLAELYRVNHDPNTGYDFAPGDRVRVTGLLKFFNGKTNINERHDTDSDNDFTVELLEPAAGLPQPELITLSQVKDAIDDFIFDYTRTIGCEYYQNRLVRINDVNITDGTWAPNEVLTITDDTGRTFDVLLGLSKGFSNFPMPTGYIDVIGIFDQEGSSTGDYRIWVPSYDGNGKVLTDRRPKPRNLYGDINNDGIVDFTDFAQFAAEWLQCAPGSGSCN
ncbi:MAG: hypothetical protein JW806_10115 [Sedimentisphaerales bacterium]|nr:hypothetical protein [Sedimentisphaerales bacterium]